MLVVAKRGLSVFLLLCFLRSPAVSLAASGSGNKTWWLGFELGGYVASYGPVFQAMSASPGYPFGAVLKIDLLFATSQSNLIGVDLTSHVPAYPMTTPFFGIGTIVGLKDELFFGNQARGLFAFGVAGLGLSDQAAATNTRNVGFGATAGLGYVTEGGAAGFVARFGITTLYAASSLNLYFPLTVGVRF